MAGQLRLTLKKSLIHRVPKHRQVLDGLGLRRRHQTVIRQDTPAIRGMIRKVEFMLEVEEI
jgi:large subunit ribosomal protein L30